MKKFIYLFSFIFLNFFAINAVSQTITTNPLNGNEYCAGTSFEVNYTATGTFQQDNVFIVQFSTDNFTTFLNIGNLKNTISGIITATLPAWIPKTQIFRIRVISSSPYIVGTDNGTDNTIYKIPKVQIQIVTKKNYYTSNTPVNLNLSDINTYINEAEWNFGNDANPKLYYGYNPPEVHYSSTGIKNITFEMKSSSTCSYYSKISTKIAIIGCEFTLDSTAFVDSINIVDADYKIHPLGNFRQFWILPNGSMNFNYSDNNVFIIETGGSLNIDGSASFSAFYLKPGSSLYVKTLVSNCAIVKSAGASIIIPDSSQNNTIIECDNIKYQYKTAPKEGIEILQRMGYLDVKDDNQNSSIYLSPNPVSDYININANQLVEQVSSIEIYNILGEQVNGIPKQVFGNEISSDGEVKVDVSGLPPGMYYVALRTKKDVHYERFVVAR